VKLAVKDRGGSVGGVPVTVPDSLIFDDDAKAANGKTIVDKLVDDEDVVALVGPYNSTVAAAQIPISNKAGLLECSPSATSEGLTRPEAGAANLRPSRPNAINFVRTVTTNEMDPVGAAMYLIDALGTKAVYIVDNGASSAVVRSDRFQIYWEGRGATVVGRQSIPSGVTDFSTLATQVKAASADVVYFSGSSGSSPTAARIVKAMRDAGLSIPFMGSGEIFDGTTSKKNSFLNLANGTDGTGVYMSYPAAGDYDGRKAFEDAFELAYGHSPSLYAITAYACTQAILDALSRTDLTVDRRDLRDAVRASAVDSRVTYDSAMGDFRFDENGDTTLQIITIYDFENGAKDWRPVGYIDVPDQ
jgi:branched-chain amino acid transport system substrate-binding protein